MDKPLQPIGPHRPRRLRRGQRVRDLVADVRLHPRQLVMPLFVRAGEQLARPVDSMPGVRQMSPDVAAGTIDELTRRGLGSFMLFGVIDPREKDATGSAALDPGNPVSQTLRQVRDAGSDALLIADLCFCEYTDHGHCGHIDRDVRLTVDNDRTLGPLGRQAAMLAECGADMVAPSGMMDGQVGAIRRALDEAGHHHTAIMSYAIKYASALYGPFRQAGEGTPQFGDRRGYQMDYRRRDEWRRELSLDLAEGADIIMIKPALAYLDVIRGVAETSSVPVAAYHVSGEYSMMHAAADRGWLDLQAGAVEATTAIARAGAQIIITYFAPQLLDWLE